MRFLPVIVSTLAATVFGLPSQPRAAHPANVNDLSKQIEGTLSTIRTNTGAISMFTSNSRLETVKLEPLD